MASTSTSQLREPPLPSEPRHLTGIATAAGDRFRLGLEGLLPTALQALEDPAGPGHAQFVRQLADLVVALVHESLEAQLDALRGNARHRGSEAGGERVLQLVSDPDRDRSADPVRRSGWEAAGGHVLRVQALGLDRALVRMAGREIVLSRRHSEIVVLLVAHPAGMTGEQLALALYGERGKPQTARAEVSRLRRLLGACIETDPYRLRAALWSDITEIERLLRDGRARDAAASYRGPLLPGSEAPGVVDLRHELDGWTRRAVLAAEDADALWNWVNTPSGQDDILAWKRLLTSVPHDDGRRALAAARLDRLRPRFAIADSRTRKVASGSPRPDAERQSPQPQRDCEAGATATGVELVPPHDHTS